LEKDAQKRRFPKQPMSYLIHKKLF